MSNGLAAFVVPDAQMPLLAMGGSCYACTMDVAQGHLSQISRLPIALCTETSSPSPTCEPMLFEGWACPGWAGLVWSVCHGGLVHDCIALPTLMEEISHPHKNAVHAVHKTRRS